MSNTFDTAPFAYVGNNKHYKELTKEELDELKQKAAEVKEVDIQKEPLPASDEVEESSASVIGPMLPQVGLTENNEPSTDDILADVDFDEFELLKESLDDHINGGETYFEASTFIENLKKKFKKDDVTETPAINHDKVMKVAKAYTETKLANSRMKLAVVKDRKVKGTAEFKELQKKSINAEKEFRKLKKELSAEDLAALDGYTAEFDSTFKKKLDAQIIDIKSAKKASIKKESCEAIECGSSDIITEKDLDPDMKPLIETLHRKGYKTKASSSGHKNVIVKADGDKDNVKYGHHYGDARLVFDGKYDLGKAPKYWYWKKVDNSDEVEYLDVMQIAADECPDNNDKFVSWKNKYMTSLKSWVNSLPDISNDKNTDVEEACQKESSEDIDAKIDTLYESVFGDIIFDILDI